MSQAAQAYIGANRGEGASFQFKLPRPQTEMKDQPRQQPSHLKQEGCKDVGHFWDDLTKIKTQAVEVRPREPATGHAFIDFQLNDAQIETKVKQLTHQELQRQQFELKQLVEQRTSNLRSYVESQAKSSQMSMNAIKGDLQKQQQLAAIQASNNYSQAQHQSRAPGVQQHESGVKGALLAELRETIAMETLQCKPIIGVDLPFQQQLKADLLQVEEIESRDVKTANMPTQSQQQSVLQMLVPGHLQPSTQEFLEEQDMDYQAIQVLPKKTPGQTQRETKQKAEQNFQERAEKIVKDDELDRLNKEAEKSREQTVKCLMKVLKQQVNAVQSQANELKKDSQAHDRELEQMKADWKRQEQEIQDRADKEQLEQLKLLEGALYHEGADELEDRPDIAEIVADNALLMGRVEHLLRQDGAAKIGPENAEEQQQATLTSDLIDDLYEVCKEQEQVKRVKQQSKPHKELHKVEKSHPLIDKKKRPQSSKYVSPSKKKTDTQVQKWKNGRKNSEQKTQNDKAVPVVTFQQDQSIGHSFGHSFGHGESSFDFRPPMSQHEIERDKAFKMKELKNKHQIVSFENETTKKFDMKPTKIPAPSRQPTQHTASLQSSNVQRSVDPHAQEKLHREQMIAQQKERTRQQRQDELRRLDDMLSQEVSSALKCQKGLLEEIIS